MLTIFLDFCIFRLSWFMVAFAAYKLFPEEARAAIKFILDRVTFSQTFGAQNREFNHPINMTSRFFGIRSITSDSNQIIIEPNISRELELQIQINYPTSNL